MISNGFSFGRSILAIALGVVGCKAESGGGGTTGDESTGTTGTSTSSTTAPPITDSTTTDASSSSTTEEASSSSTGEPAESSSSSTGEPMGVGDIDMTLVVDQMAASLFTDTHNFSEASCPLSEMCITEAGERRLLYFSTITPNVGEGDFIVGSPDLEPEKFEWGECHGHWHFRDFASYQLLDAKMNVVATGHKMSFALIDLAQYWDDAEAGRGKYPLPDGTQGITLGWADVYNWGLDCQWVDITGVPSGDYTLEVSINPEQVVEELSYDNNIALIPVTITDEDTGMPAVPKTWTCDPAFYATVDGCDCGCGEFDPDCKNPQVDACDYCDNEGSCAEVGGCPQINDNDNSTCD